MRIIGGAALLLLLAACGGGGGGGSGAVQIPLNAAPTIGTAAAQSIVENGLAVVQLTASDADNDPLTWSITGGTDGDRFALNGSQLNFIVGQNFDAPGDANSDNIFNVAVAVSDGKTSVSRSIDVTVTNSREGVFVRKIGSIGEPWVGAARVGDNGIRLASEQGVYRYDAVTDSIAQQFRWTQNVGGPQGRFLSIAADRSLGEALLMMVSVRLTDGRLLLYQLPKDTTQDFAFSIAPAIYQLPYDPAVAEVGGQLQACPNGSLCLATSAEGKPATANDSLYGALLAFQPNPDPYAGASVGPAYYAPTVFASGLRLPLSLDSGPEPGLSPYLLVLDRGTTRWDEINRSVNGNALNYGWPYREGNETVSSGGPATPTDPEVQFRRGTGFRDTNGLTALGFYRGTSPSLAGKVIVGDRDGRIFAVPSGLLINQTTEAGGTIENRTADFKPDNGSIDRVAAILSVGSKLLILDADGDLFVFDG